MGFMLRGPKRRPELLLDEPIDVAGVIARALNRAPDEPVVAEPAVGPVVAEPAVGPVVAEPAVGPVVAEPAVGPVAPEPAVGPVAPEPVVVESPEPVATATPEPVDVGVTVRLPFGTAPEDDPLLSELLALGNSLIYDVTAAVGAHRCDEIVVQLPPGETAEFAARVGGSWGGWRPSGHSLGVLEVFRALLHDVDPAAGYDVVVRPRETIVCRWPHRAWDIRDPEPAGTAEEPTGEPQSDAPKRKRRALRRRS
jgi:hypothetical protein